MVNKDVDTRKFRQQEEAVLTTDTSNEFKNKTPEAIAYIKEQIRINENIKERYGEKSAYDGIYSPDTYFNRTENRIVIALKEVNQKDNSKWCPVSDPDNIDYNIHPDKKNKVATRISESLSDLLHIEDTPKDYIYGIGYINISK